MLSDQRQTIREGRFPLRIPRRRVARYLAVGLQPHTQQHDQRKQSQQHRRRAGYRLRRPLPLRLHSQVRPRLRNRDLDRPPHHDPTENLCRRRFHVRAAEGFVAQPACRVSDQDITNLDGALARPIPQGGARPDQYLLLHTAVLLDFDFGPRCVAARRPLFEPALARALERFAPTLACRWWPRRVIQTRIEPQPRHQRDILPAQHKASLTAAKPPSTTNTRTRSGSHRRTTRTSVIRRSIVVLCACGRCLSFARHKTVRKGKAHTRLLHGSLTSSISESHFKPKHLTTCFWEERTASRSHPTPLILRPRRRSIVSSAPRTMTLPGGSTATSRPSRTRLAESACHLARFKTR